MFDKSVEDAIVQEDTDFFDALFRMSDRLKSATHGDAGYSLLHFAARHSTERMVKYFLDNGFSSDCRTFYNQTALHVAVMYCRCGVVKLLSQQGCPLDARDSMGRTALHYAMEIGKMRQISSNNTRSNISRTESTENPSEPRERGDTDKLGVISTLLRHSIISTQQDNTPFCTEERSEHHFSSTDNRDIIDHLLQCGADVNASTQQEDTPLIQAVARGSESLVRLFLDCGANINHCKKGYNALHYAAPKSNKNIVEMLLDAGAEVNSTTASEGQTALHLAASSADSEEIVNLLIERGALVEAKDHMGETPILKAVGPNVNYAYRYGSAEPVVIDDFLTASIVELIARLNPIERKVHGSTLDKLASDARYGEPETNERRHRIIHSLLNAGAGVNHSSDAGEPAFYRALSTGVEAIIEPFLERGADVRCKNASGWSALHAAVKYASEKVVGSLIARGAPVNERTPDGTTPLHIAVEFGHETHVKLLLARGADVNATDSKGCTPLHYAALAVDEKHKEYHPLFQKILGILLDNNADPCVRSIQNGTPLDCAVLKHNTEFIETLLRHLAYLQATGDTKATEVATGDNDLARRLVYVMALAETSSMKKEKIYANVSYFDMITLDLKTWVQNDEFVEAFKNNQKIREFYFYGKVSQRFKDALNRKEAIEYLTGLFSHGKLPILICEMIAKYCEPEDHEALVRACEGD